MEPQRNRDAHIVRKSMVLRAVRWDRRDYIGLSSTLDYMRFRGEKRVARHYMRLQGLKDSRWFWRQRGLQGLIIRGALDYMRGKAFVFWLNLWNIAVKHWSSWSRCAGESLRASPCGQVLASKPLRGRGQAPLGSRVGPWAALVGERARVDLVGLIPHSWDEGRPYRFVMSWGVILLPHPSNDFLHCLYIHNFILFNLGDRGLGHRHSPRTYPALTHTSVQP